MLDAAQRGDVKTISTALLDTTIDLNESDEKGYTALHHASYFEEVCPTLCTNLHCKAEIVSLLLANERVNWKVSTNTGLSCLHLAAMNNSIRVVDVLLTSDK